MALFDQTTISDLSASEREDIYYIRNDRGVVVQIKSALAGSRGLYNTLMQMAMYLNNRPDIKRGCLVLLNPRISLPRISEEWKASKKLFARHISSRLGIVVLGDEGEWQSPDDTLNKKIARTFAFAIDSQQSNDDLVLDVKPRPGQKFYEVLKVLLIRWLQREEPIALGRLADQVGCSYPTVKEALERKSLSTSVTFTSNRSVALKAFPHDAWKELLALTDEMRKSFRFSDRTGGTLKTDAILKRIRRINDPRLAISGVVAARHWHHDFDLNGTPRIDLCYHAPSGEADLRFVKRLDPALTMLENLEGSPKLVVHAIVRAVPLFTRNDRNNLPWADPIETVLDLNDLRLTAQASQLINHLRPEARI